MPPSGSSYSYTVEQVELIRRLRNSGLTCEQLIAAYWELDRLDRELGLLYANPVLQAAVNPNRLPKNGFATTNQVTSLPRATECKSLCVAQTTTLSCEGTDSTEEKQLEEKNKSDESSHIKFPNKYHDGPNNSFPPTSSTVDGLCAISNTVSSQNSSSTLQVSTSSLFGGHQSSNLTGSVPEGIQSSLTGVNNAGVNSMPLLNTSSFADMLRAVAKKDVLAQNATSGSGEIIQGTPPGIGDALKEYKNNIVCNNEAEEHRKAVYRSYVQSLRPSDLVYLIQNVLSRCPDWRPWTWQGITEVAFTSFLGGELHLLDINTRQILVDSLVERLRALELLPADLLSLQGPDEKDISDGLKVKFVPRSERFNFQTAHLQVLEAFFKKSQYPSLEEKEFISDNCNSAYALEVGRQLTDKEKMAPAQVSNWFSNRRKEIMRIARKEGIETDKVVLPRRAKISRPSANECALPSMLETTSMVPFALPHSQDDSTSSSQPPIMDPTLWPLQSSSAAQLPGFASKIGGKEVKTEVKQQLTHNVAKTQSGQFVSTTPDGQAFVLKEEEKVEAVPLQDMSKRTDIVGSGAGSVMFIKPEPFDT